MLLYVVLHSLKSLFQLLVFLKSNRDCKSQLNLADRDLARLINVKFLKTSINTLLQVIFDQISNILFQLINYDILFVEKWHLREKALRLSQVEILSKLRF